MWVLLNHIISLNFGAFQDFCLKISPQNAVCHRILVRITQMHGRVRGLSTLIHLWGCWGKPKKPFPTSEGVAPTHFHRIENVENLSPSVTCRKLLSPLSASLGKAPGGATRSMNSHHRSFTTRTMTSHYPDHFYAKS